ncbi:unnamed protein product [Miscanthus lutarioriparius]|uniref:DNA-directed DNA polymerase n=1 Tax=Miscanthus lutarioriparius TaxID=422564 RepID=A0A811SG60_9POAL|nr:unnamed protein product [Miscanthus lutarioriparius]
MPPLAIVSTPGPLSCLTRRRTSPRGADDTRALIYRPRRDVKEVRGIGLSRSKLERADLGRKIHPVVSRLCASIQGTSPARLAECLGLDSAKFQSRVTESSNQDTSTMLLYVIDDEDERYRGCEPLRLSCPSCSGTFDCPHVSSLITSSTSVSDPNDVLCKTLLDDVLCKTRLLLYMY